MKEKKEEKAKEWRRRREEGKDARSQEIPGQNCAHVNECQAKLK